GGAFFAAPPDIREAVCMVAGDLQKKDRKKLMEEPGFEVSGPAQFTAINNRYFLSAAIPDESLPTQCIAGANADGVMTVALQWGDEGGRPFSLRSGVDSCLPDYVKPEGRFEGRMRCADAARLLGLKGDEDFRTIDAV